MSRKTGKRAVAGMRTLASLAVFVGAGLVATPATVAAPGGGRAYELVSPPDKGGGDITGNTTRTRAAADGSAAMFSSLGAFGDVLGTGVATEYMSIRSASRQPGDNGWRSHAITPRQQPQNIYSPAFGLEPRYEGEFSANLSQGVFRAWSPLTDAPNVAETLNLYLRNDLRTPGAGSYALLSDCPACAAPFGPLSRLVHPFQAGSSQGFRHVIFEYGLNLTSDAPPQPFLCVLAALGCNARLYDWADGTTRLAGLLPGGRPAARSAVGVGLLEQSRPAFGPISQDGSHIAFTVAPQATDSSGALYERINGSTTIQLNATERSAPNAAQAARYWDASSDHSRIFFTSAEALTDGAPDNGDVTLYMWERQATNEAQVIDVDATGGTFALRLAIQPATGTGMLTNGSTTITDVAAEGGAFSVGQTISGPGIDPGTTIVDMGPFSGSFDSTLTLSAPATADGAGQSLSAIVNGATGTLPFDASAAQVQTALEGLPGVGDGNVSVTGGPGGAAPLTVAFAGDLAGINMPELTADSSLLMGGARTVAVATANEIRNLTRLNVDQELADSTNHVTGVVGASDDGRNVYFVASGRLVPDAPVGLDRGVYLWHDGTISYVGEGNLTDGSEWHPGESVNFNLLQARVTPNGRDLLLSARSGSGLLSEYGRPDYVHNGFRELYVYSADDEQLRCASCNPSGAPATTSAVASARFNSGGSLTGTYVNRAISDDGRFAFFSTAEALIPEDVNGAIDAYEFDVASGRPRLLSSGTDPADSYYLDASANANDAFFVTREQLVGWDVDSAYDLYDARVGGGFPEPPLAPPACSGVTCRGPLAVAPGVSGAGTGTYRGSGNSRATPRARARTRRARRRACRRGRVRKRVRGRARCVSRRPSRTTRQRTRAANQRRAK